MSSNITDSVPPWAIGLAVAFLLLIVGGLCYRYLGPGSVQPLPMPPPPGAPGPPGARPPPVLPGPRAGGGAGQGVPDGLVATQPEDQPALRSALLGRWAALDHSAQHRRRAGHLRPRRRRHRHLLPGQRQL